jgi:hypothetical protein
METCLFHLTKGAFITRRNLQHQYLYVIKFAKFVISKTICTGSISIVSIICEGLMCLSINSALFNAGAILTSPLCIARATHPTLRTAVCQIRVVTADAFRSLPNTHLFILPLLFPTFLLIGPLRRFSYGTMLSVSCDYLVTIVSCLEASNLLPPQTLRNV